MEVPTVQEKSEQIFFVQPKAHQFKFTDLNKMVPTDPLKLIAFFEQSQTNKAAGVLKKIAKDKKQPKEKKTAQLPVACSRELATNSIILINIATTIKATEAIVTITIPTILI